MKIEWIDTECKKPHWTDSPILVKLKNETVHVAYWQDEQRWFVGGWESCCYCGGQSMINFCNDDMYSHDEYPIQWSYLKEVKEKE